MFHLKILVIKVIITSLFKNQVILGLLKVEKLHDLSLQREPSLKAEKIVLYYHYCFPLQIVTESAIVRTHLMIRLPK